MRKLLCMIAALSFIMLYIPAYADGEPEIGSAQAVLLDSNSGQILYEKDSTKAIGGGAAAKMMSVYAYRGKDNIVYKVPGDVSFANATPLEEGHEISSVQLKQEILVGGYDDCAYALSLGDKDLVKHMNDAAKTLKLVDTHFTDSYDSNDKEQTSTVKDLAQIGRAFAGDEKLREYYGCLQTADGKATRQLPTYDGLIGGFADSSAVVYSAERGNTRLTVAVSGGADVNAMQEDIVKLLDHGFAGYKSVKISKDDIGVKETDLEVGDVKKHYEFYIPSDLYALMKAEADESKLTTDIIMLDDKDPERIQAYLVIYMDGNEIGRITMQKKVTETRLKSPQEQIREYFDMTCLGIAGVGVVLFIFKYVTQLIKPQ